MKVEFNKIDSLKANLDVHIAQADYLNEFKEEINKQKSKGNMKGFRPGKTPASYVKKVFGDQILAELINKKAIQSMYDYLKENNIEIILDPILDEENGVQTINHRELQDYKFSFLVGLSPEFEIDLLSSGEEFTKFKVVPTATELDENLVKIATQLGETVTVESDIQPKDIVTLMGDNLLTDDEGLTEPIEVEIKVLVSDASEKFQKEVEGKKLNDNLSIALADIEDKDDNFIRKYYLKMDVDDERSFQSDIEAAIVNVQRVESLEVGPEMFKKIFPDQEIETKEDALAKLSEHTTTEHDGTAQNLVYRDMMEKLMEQSSIPLPEDFLLTWAKRTKSIKEGVEDDQFLDHFTKELKWNLIKGKLLKTYDIKVEQEEIIEHAKKQVMGYFGYRGADNDQYINMIVGNLLKDEEQYRKIWDEVLTLKMYRELEKNLTIKEEETSVAEFYLIVEDFNNKDK